MKLRYKILLLGIIWAITYPLCGVFYIKYARWDFALICGYANWIHWSEVARHPIGYCILGFFFGIPAMVLAIIDEPIQLLVKSKGFSLIQMIWNIVGAGFGIWVSRFIKISWRER